MEALSYSSLKQETEISQREEPNFFLEIDFYINETLHRQLPYSTEETFCLLAFVSDHQGLTFWVVTRVPRLRYVKF